MEMLFGFWFCSPLFKACLSKSSLAIAVGFGRFEGVWKNMLFLLFGSMVSNFLLDEGVIEILLLLWIDFIDGVFGIFVGDGGWGDGLVLGLVCCLVFVDLLLGGLSFGFVKNVLMSVLVDLVLVGLADGFGVVLNEILILFGFGLDDVLFLGWLTSLFSL